MGREQRPPVARVRDDLPSGTVTLLFTDVEGSTRLLHALGTEGYAQALAEHRRSARHVSVRAGWKWTPLGSPALPVAKDGATRLESGLSVESFGRLRGEGRELSLEEAVELASSLD